MPELEDMLEYIGRYTQLIGMSPEHFMIAVGLDPHNERHVETLYRLMREHGELWTRFFTSMTTDMEVDHVLSRMEEVIDIRAPETIINFIRDVAASNTLPESEIARIHNALEELSRYRKMVGGYKAALNRLKREVERLREENARLRGELERMRRTAEERGEAAHVKIILGKETPYLPEEAEIVQSGAERVGIRAIPLPRLMMNEGEFAELLRRIGAFNPKLSDLLLRLKEAIETTHTTPPEITRLYVVPSLLWFVEFRPTKRGRSGEVLYTPRLVDLSYVYRVVARIMGGARRTTAPAAGGAAGGRVEVPPAYRPFYEWARRASFLSRITPYLPKKVSRMLTSADFFKRMCGVNRNMSDEEIRQRIYECAGIDVPLEIIRHWKEMGYL